MMSKIAIVDYGVGNLYSIQKLLDFLEMDWMMASKEKDFDSCNGIILPGVGAFGDAMQEMQAKGLDEIIIRQVDKGKILLGICLGMQILFARGTEGGIYSGLGILDGSIEAIPDIVKVPHTGWNSIERVLECNLLEEISSKDYMYFVHSYYAEVLDTSIIKATTTYGVSIPAVVNKDNVYGVQFHPEKSGSMGIKIINNFRRMVI